MKKRILVVDDEELVRGSLAAVLEQMGFATDAAGDGSKALAMIERRRYDLIITDYQMPVMDGAALAREMKRRRPSCRIVAMTGCQDLSSLLEAGVDFVVQKPFSLADISLIVQRALHGRGAEAWKGSSPEAAPTTKSPPGGATASPSGQS